MKMIDRGGSMSLTNNDSSSNQTNNIQTSAVTLKINWKIISIILGLVSLFLIILICLAYRDSLTGFDKSRTINVKGEAEISAEPDELVFYPYYEFDDTDAASALKKMQSTQTEIVKKLKELGVEDSKIKSNSDNFNSYYSSPEIVPDSKLRLNITINVGNRDLAQKVQDYLLTTQPKGVISPQANFSTAKRKSLQEQLRNQATKEARSKADQMAKDLGFKVGKVKSVSDSENGLYPMMKGGDMGVENLEMGAAGNLDSANETRSSLAVQPGEDKLFYQVTVVYYLK